MSIWCPWLAIWWLGLTSGDWMRTSIIYYSYQVLSKVPFHLPSFSHYPQWIINSQLPLFRILSLLLYFLPVCFWTLWCQNSWGTCLIKLIKWLKLIKTIPVSMTVSWYNSSKRKYNSRNSPIFQATEVTEVNKLSLNVSSKKSSCKKLPFSRSSRAQRKNIGGDARRDF